MITLWKSKGYDISGRRLSLNALTALDNENLISEIYGVFCRSISDGGSFDSNYYLPSSHENHNHADAYGEPLSLEEAKAFVLQMVEKYGYEEVFCYESAEAAKQAKLQYQQLGRIYRKKEDDNA